MIQQKQRIHRTYYFQPRISRISRIGRALAALGEPSGRGFRQESQKFALIRIIGYAELKVRGQENLFNPQSVVKN